MRRVRLDELCETKKDQAARSGWRIRLKCLRSVRGTSSPDLSASAFCTGISAVRSSTSLFSRVDREPILPHAGTLCQSAIWGRNINDASCFLEAITDAVE